MENTRIWARKASTVLAVVWLGLLATARPSDAACAGGESPTCFEMSIVFKPHEPQSTRPWLQTEVTSIDAVSVRLSMWANLDVFPETIVQVYLNLDPRIDPKHLKLVYDAAASTGPAAVSVSRGVDCCEADDNRFDLRLDFPASLVSDRFDGSDVVIYTVKCAHCTPDELAAFGPASFDFLSWQKRPEANSLRSAARINGIPPCEDGQLGSCNRGWIGAPPIWEPPAWNWAACDGSGAATCFVPDRVLDGHVPQSPLPWAWVEVLPYGGTSLRLVFVADLETFPELVGRVLLNLDPRIDPTRLRFVHDWRNSTGPPVSKLTLGRDCCRGPDGWYDVEFLFPASLSGPRLDGTEVVVYAVECAGCEPDELAAFGVMAFDFGSASASLGAAGGGRIAVRIHGIPPCEDGELGSCNRGWIGE